MNNLSHIEKSIKYAPGLSTYGIDGNDGKQGIQGNCIFISRYVFEESNKNVIVSRIRNNQTITEDAKEIGREYINDDIFVDPLGDLYKLINKSDLILDDQVFEFTHFFEYVATIKIDKDVTSENFENSDDRLVNKSAKGLDIIYGASDIEIKDILNNVNTLEPLNAHSCLRVIACSNSVNDNGNSNLLSLSSKFAVENENALNFYYSQDYNAYVLDSNVPLVINSSMIEIRTDDYQTPVIDNYSRIYTFSNNISKDYNTFSNFEYSINNGDDGMTEIRISHVSGESISNYIDPDEVHVSIYSKNKTTGEIKHYIKDFVKNNKVEMVKETKASSMINPGINSSLVSKTDWINSVDNMLKTSQVSAINMKIDNIVKKEFVNNYIWNSSLQFSPDYVFKDTSDIDYYKIEIPEESNTEITVALIRRIEVFINQKN